ncbi:hypothetical protein [Methyloversatilis sp.]|uniref:hypothetical protein n=1 Tax=Methyloversatilis sp. TaxID=2569862 RepID=UPI002733B9F8|nr:hypothetical protein [Methyloversatilis sp.]MDP3579131.1 hypothetical protein [Methyloversatilis sp.]
MKWSGFVAVPEDFFGINVHRWPNGYPTDTAEPSFGYKTYRIWDHKTADNKYLLWVTQNPSAGVYDWTQLDIIVAELEARGIQGWYVLSGTPAFARLGGAFSDPYGNPSGASPADPAFVTAFVTALLQRYNAGGRRFFRYIEPWNEPAWDGSSGFYKGTAAQMAAICRAVYIAAKAVDPEIVVTTPSDWSAAGHLAGLFAASDGAGGTGKDWLDAVCVHPYYRWWDDDPFLRTGQGTNVGVYMRALRTNLAAAGVSGKPIIWGETGYASSPSSPEHIAISSSPNKDQLYAKWAFRQALGCIIEGVSAMLLYDYDGPLALSGNPVTSPVISQAWDAINKLCGTNMLEVRLVDGQYVVRTSKGFIYA